MARLTPIAISTALWAWRIALPVGGWAPLPPGLARPRGGRSRGGRSRGVRSHRVGFLGVGVRGAVTRGAAWRAPMPGGGAVEAAPTPCLRTVPPPRHLAAVAARREGVVASACPRSGRARWVTRWAAQRPPWRRVTPVPRGPPRNRSGDARARRRFPARAPRVVPPLAASSTPCDDTLRDDTLRDDALRAPGRTSPVAKGGPDWQPGSAVGARGRLPCRSAFPTRVSHPRFPLVRRVAAC